ncbi:hypothetical protein LZ32DRAFT_616663 [Colletotrichum eremochloae]|nr:hypothetical protein LZ32DRAFT_616663 [Colletotrichum eremochloae]
MSATKKPYKCPEKHCTAALTTKSNLNRHMRQHRKIQMPCGKELRDHPTNNLRHQKNCGECKSVHAAKVRRGVVAEASGDTYPLPDTPTNGSAFLDQHILYPAMPESHTAPEYATSANSEIQYLAAIDPKTEVHEQSLADWPTDPGAGTGDGLWPQ